MFELVKSAYDERSNLSHGRSSTLTSANPESVRVYLSKIEDVLTRTIHFFMQAEINNKIKEDVLKLIDAAIATQDRATLESSLTSKY